MTRPCSARHPDPAPDRCRLCWLYLADPRYSAAWGYAGPLLFAPPPPAVGGPALVPGGGRSSLRLIRCEHVGALVGPAEGPSCRRTYRCLKGHPVAVPAGVCQECPDYEPDKDFAPEDLEGYGVKVNVTVNEVR